MLTPEQLAEIEAADLHSLQADAQHNPDVWTLNEWRKQLLAEVKQLREQMAAVEKFVAARAEYITAINNCHPDNSADYWRWQGGAEARRQLAQTLDLPVAWPAQEERQC